VYIIYIYIYTIILRAGGELGITTFIVDNEANLKSILSPVGTYIIYPYTFSSLIATFNASRVHPSLMNFAIIA
jgi:hypothetical protein